MKTKKGINKKGQGAMEYLMTYGWAILVVLVVGVALWQLGIFNLGGTTITATGFATLKPQLAACGLSSAGDFECMFTNTAGTQITINSGNITVTGGSSCLLASTPSTVTVGKNFVIADANATCNPSVSGVSPGDPYEAAVSINYTVNIGGTTSTHSSTGVLHGPYE